MGLFRNGEYRSRYDTTFISNGGMHTEPKFKTKQGEDRFHAFLNKETKRIFQLKLPENEGKNIDDIKNDVFNMHFPRWEE